MDQNDIDRIPSWFHSIELEPGLVTPSRFSEDFPPNFTLFPVFQFLENIDVSGRACMDIGAMDGITSFILGLKGGSVVSTDLYEHESYLMIREHLELSKRVAYLTDAPINFELERRLEANNLHVRFDLIVMAGVIYHTFDPLINILVARHYAKDGGLVIVETARHPGDEPALYLNWDAPRGVPEAQTYFLPTAEALKSMLRFACLDPIATVTNGGRVAAIARATTPDKISESSDILQRLHSSDWKYGPVEFMGIKGQISRSNIQYTGPKGMWDLDAKSFTTSLPLQPAWRPR